jgi:hypothetical protein
MNDIAPELGSTPEEPARWRQWCLLGGLAALGKDAPRPGATPTIPELKVQQVSAKTTREKPTNATHWSTRTMAKVEGLSEASVRRIGAPTA